MKNTLLHQAAKFKLQNRKHKRWQKAVSILACIVVFCTVYALILPALTAEGTPHCGIEEHTHTDECYENRLICGKEEGEGAHTHTDECYTQEQTLICGLEEGEGAHTHTEECYDEEGNLICGLEENEGHQHTEECYQTENILTCDQEESEGHQHTAECYEQVLACGKEEHAHSLACYSDPNADVEDADTWQNSVSSVSLTGNWGSDLAAIAQTQIGYRESTSNYNVAEDGATMNGYTRYGAWAGDPYRDNWSAQFTDFCLSYAGIPTSAMIQVSNCQEWAPVPKSGYAPSTGDIIILDGNQDGTADHAGIVLSANEAQVTTVIGDSDKEVKKNVYNLDNAIIMGYLTMPKNPNFDYGDAEPEETPEATPEPAMADEEEETPEALDDETSFMAATGNDGDAASNPSNDPDGIRMDQTHITGLTGNGTVYDKDGDIYSSDLKLNFKFNKADIEKNGYNYYYEYPDGIIIPDKLTDGQKHDLNDNAGTYRFEKTSEGKYRVVIEFNTDYVSKAGETITGNVQFSGKISADKADKDGKIEIKGTDGVELVIPKEEITYPSDETNAYDISVSKSGSYRVEDGKLVYTVYVSSLKGTPSEIDFKDKITVEGLTLGSSPTISVKKEKVKRYNQWTEHPLGNLEDVSVSPSYNNGEIQMILPKIDKAEAKKDENDSDYKEYTRYKIEYTYDITGMTGVTPKADNEVNVSSKDQETEVKDKATSTVTIKNEHSLDKRGEYNSSENKIKWTITVNANQVDIAGSELTDSMLANLAAGENITITPSSGYTIEKDSNEKITKIKFNAINGGKNLNKYEIIYWTEVKAGWNSQNVDNTAHFKPKDGPEIDKTGTVTVGGGWLEKKVSTAIPSKDGMTAEIPWIVILNVPEGGLQSGLEITDDATKDEWGGSSAKQYMTAEQVKKWVNDISWLDSNDNQIGEKLLLTEGNLADISFMGSDGKQYTYEEAIKASDITFTVWSVKLKQDITRPDGAKKLVFKYSTTADLSTLGAGSKTYYKNYVQVGDKKASASYEYKKGGLIKTDENGSTAPSSKENKDGLLTWKITAILDSKSKVLNVTDTLPERVKLINIKGEDEISGLSDITIDASGNISGNNGNYQVTGTYNNNVAEVKLERQNGQELEAKTYTFVLTCKVDTDTLSDYQTGKTYTFTNRATAKNDKGSIGNASQEQQWTERQSSTEKKVIDKTGNWDNGTRRVKYSINLNPDGKDIVEGSELMTLRDVFSYYNVVYAQPDGNGGNAQKYTVDAELVPSTVKLYKATCLEDGTLVKGTEITNWSWTVTTGTDGQLPNWEGGITQTSTIVAENIPDSTPLILEYEYQFTSNIPEKYHSTSAITVKNSATLEGTGYKDDKSQTDTKWEKQEHSGQVSTDKTYTLYKVSKGNYGKLLAGAKFKLQKYNGSDYEDASVTYVTNKEGKIIIRWQRENQENDPKYEFNTLYRVVETEAPAGYEKPADPESEAIYFYFSNSDDTEHTLPSDLPSNACDLSEKSQVAYIENEATTTEITVNKKWVDRNGSVDTSKKGSITFNLYQTETLDEPGKGSIGTLSGAIMIGDFTNGHVLRTFDPTKYPVGTQISFRLHYSRENNGSSINYLKLNGKVLTPKITDLSKGSHCEYNYEYSFRITAGMNKLEGVTNDWYTDWKLVDFNTTPPVKGNEQLVETYTVTSEEGWSKTIDQLPAFTINKNGEKVYYTYYVKEVSVSGYDTSYDNNGGIGSGIITVINQQNQSYELPETGGIGTNRFTAVGLALMAGSLMCGYVMRRKRRERREK